MARGTFNDGTAQESRAYAQACRWSTCRPMQTPRPTEAGTPHAWTPASEADMPTLFDQIEHELQLVRGARERDDPVAECRHRTHLDKLLTQVPRDITAS